MLNFVIGCLLLTVVSGCSSSSSSGGGGADDGGDYPPIVSSMPWQMFHSNRQHTGQSDYPGPRTSNFKWKYTRAGVSKGNLTNSFSISGDNVIYVVMANYLLAFTSAGELSWSVALDGSGATAIATDETVVYAVGGHTLYAFTSSGEALWSYSEPTENIYGEPCVASDGTIYFGSWDTYIYALNPDGTLKWRYQTDGAIAPMASPTLSVDESIIYVGSGDPNKDNGGSLYAINSDGTLRWKYEGLSSMRVSGPVVGPNGRIYACASSRVYCFSSSGSLIWQSDNDTAGNLCPALSSQEVVYVGTAQGKIFALNASNGSTLWSYQTGANPDYDPDNPHDPEYGVLTAPICGADGVVYVGAVDGKMYALNVDGSLLWTYETGDSIVENCPAIGPDGALYFISEDGYAYCVKD